MKTLLLLRHAKAMAPDAYPDDHERPLTERGREAATHIGQYVHKQHDEPGQILCSTAERTRQTADAFIETAELSSHIITYERALYLASARELLHQVNQLDDAHDCAILIGHNPGIHMLAIELAGEGEPHMLSSLGMHFPTAALAVLHCDVASWADVVPRSNMLADYTTPKLLGE